MDIRDLPRVVWALAAARFVSSAASFTMLFLTLYLTGPRGMSTAAAGLMLAVVPLMPLWVLVALLPAQAYLMATGSLSSGPLSALAVPRGQRRTSVAVGRAASNAGFVLGPPLGALLVSGVGVVHRETVVPGPSGRPVPGGLPHGGQGHR